MPQSPFPQAAFTFAKLVVADLARAEAFYAAAFGLQVRHRHSSDEHAYGQEESILFHPDREGTTALILTRYLRRPAPPAGGAWVGFVVPDIDSTAALIEATGGAVEVPVHAPDSHPVRALVATDPDGHVIEVIELLPGS